MRAPIDANRYVGLPYVAHGVDRSGVDCWGLVRLVYAEHFGIEVTGGPDHYDPRDPRQVADIMAGPYREGWTETADPQPGDIVLLRILRYPSHVGILVRPGLMLHARDDHAVVVESLDRSPWKHRIVGYFRHERLRTERDTGVELAGVPHPLRTASVQTIALPGRTLRELITGEALRAGAPERLLERGHAWIDGEYIPADEWDNYRPRAGQRVEYRLLPGSDNIKLILVAIIVVVAMVVFQQWYLGLAGTGAGGAAAGTVAGLSGWGMVGYAAGTVAIAAAGAALANAIAPVRPPDDNGASLPERKNRLVGGQNQMLPYSCIPVVLGEHRFTPPSGAEPYVESQGGDVYLRLAVIWGYGPLAISDLRIGDVAINLFEEVQQAHLSGSGFDNAEARAAFDRLYARDVDQETVSIKLETLVDNERSLGSTNTELSVNLHFPTGLWKTPTEGGNAGDVDPLTVKVKVKYRLTGSGTWLQVGSEPGAQGMELHTAYTLSTIDYFTGDADLAAWWLATYQGVKINLREHTQVPLWVWCDLVLDDAGNLVAFYGDPTDSQFSDPSEALQQIFKDTNYGTWDWGGSLWWGGAALPTYSRLPNYSGSFVPLWRVCIKDDGIVSATDIRDARVLTGGALTYSANDRNVLVAAMTIDRSTDTDSMTIRQTRATKEAFDIVLNWRVPAGAYDVQVTLHSEDDANVHYDDSGNDGVAYRDCYWTTLTGFANNRPIVDPKPLAKSSFRIKASNQLSGTLEGINAIVRSIGLDWSIAHARTITYVQRVSNVVTVWTAVKHGYLAGGIFGNQSVDIAVDVSTGVNGSGFAITSVPDAYSFTYTKTGADITKTAQGGSSTATPVGGGVWAWRHSRNPASLFRLVLQHPANARPVANADIDLVKLQEWHNFCRLSGYTFDTVVVDQKPLLELLRDIASAGRASPTLVDGKWSVTIDSYKPTVVQTFTPQNSWGFEGQRRLVKMPHGFRVRFYNRAKAWQADERVVYDDGYAADYVATTTAQWAATTAYALDAKRKPVGGSSTRVYVVIQAGTSGGSQPSWPATPGATVNDGSVVWMVYADATLLERIDLPGVTEENTVYALGRFHIAQLVLRPDTYVINTDAEHLICTRGDRVKVNHDVPMWGRGSGRIKLVTRDGSNNILSVTLDESIAMKASGESYTMLLRKSANNAKLTIALNAPGADGDYATLNLTTPFVDANVQDGDLCLVGLVGSEAVDCLVQMIEPQANLTARLTLVDYAPAVFTSDDEAIPAYSSQITLPPPPLRQRINTQMRPNVTRVQTDEPALRRSSTGALQAGILVGFRAQAKLPKDVQHVEAQYAHWPETVTHPTWVPMPPAPIAQRSVWLGPLKEGKRYRVRLRYVDLKGRVGRWADPSTYPDGTDIYTVVGRASPPPNVTGLALTYDDSLGFTLDWSDCKDIDLKNYRVRRAQGAGLDPATAWDTASAVKVVTVSQYRLGFLKPGPAYTYMVKAVDTTGNESPLAAAITMDVDAPVVAQGLPVINGNQYTLNWTTTTKTFPVVNHEIRIGGTSWGTATLLGFSQSTVYSGFVLQAAPYTFRVKAIDAAGNYSAESVRTAILRAPRDVRAVTTFTGTLA